MNQTHIGLCAVPALLERHRFAEKFEDHRNYFPRQALAFACLER
jgi:hypothetical protein